MLRAREIPPFASFNPCYLEGSVSDKDNEILDDDFCCMKCQNMPEIDRTIDEPSKVIPMKKRFLKIPSKILKWLSRRLQLTELKIWANTKALNTRVLTIRLPSLVSSG